MTLRQGVIAALGRSERRRARPRCSTFSPAFIRARPGLGQAARPRGGRPRAGRHRPARHGALVPGRPPVPAPQLPGQNVALGVQDQVGEQVLPLFARPGATHGVRAGDGRQGHGVAASSSACRTSPTCPPERSPSASRSWCRWPACWRRRPRCILLDEPASGIDSVWLDTMLGLIESLRSRGPHDLHRRAQPARGRTPG